MLAIEIRELRQALELTQKQFAALVGVSLPAVIAWEAGGNTPRMGVTAKMAEIRSRLPGDKAKFQELAELKTEIVESDRATRGAGKSVLISMTLDSEELRLIDLGAEASHESRAKFLREAAIARAKKVLRRI
jgi:transcriptional regulator with XRE-family HTH domain